MQRCGAATAIFIGFVLACGGLPGAGAQVREPHSTVTVTVVDENGLPVSGAQVSVSEPGRPVLQLQTDYAGRCYLLTSRAIFRISLR